MNKLSYARTANKYLKLVKFSHTVFALPFALIGFSLAVFYDQKDFQLRTFILVLLSMIFARSAAMAFNRWLDRNIDAKNPRTSIREIPAGFISARHALTFTIVNCLLFILVTWFINLICFFLSPVALFVILFYSYTKRFTPLCHLVLGLGLSLAPIGAYLAVTGFFDWLPLLFSGIVFTWVAGFDIIYALQDEAFDKENHLFSIPAVLGKKNALRVSALLHFITAVLVIVAGYLSGLGLLYWIGAALFIALLVVQHRLVSPDDLSKVNAAFALTNGVGSLIFAAFTICELIFY